MFINLIYDDFILITKHNLLDWELVTTLTSYTFPTRTMSSRHHGGSYLPFSLPLKDGDSISFLCSFSEWEVFQNDFGFMGKDVSAVYDLMQAVEEERNRELDRQIRILGAALDAMDNVSEFKSAKWFGRGDPWTRLYPGPSEDDEWPAYRVWAHFMLWPLEGDVPEVLGQAEEDADYEAWINSKQYVKSLEEYNMHKLLAFEKGQSPDWVGECTEDKATTTAEKCVLYNTFLKDRFKLDAVVRTEFPNQWGNKGYAKASSPYGDIYIPNKFNGYIGIPGDPITLTVALQDVGGGGRKANGYRFTCLYIH